MSEKVRGPHSRADTLAREGPLGSRGGMQPRSPCFCRLSSKGSPTSLREPSQRPKESSLKVAEGKLSGHPPCDVCKP